MNMADRLKRIALGTQPPTHFFTVNVFMCGKSSHNLKPFVTVVVGQGQGKKASQLIEKGMQHGDWFEILCFISLKDSN